SRAHRRRRARVCAPCAAAARGRGLEAPRRRRAGIAFAWERGASCRVHTPERKLRMKLLWQAKMSSIQDWGEEVEEGAVYHVTLKRVQIQQAANKGARWLGNES
uniref:Ral guanine nucleotide dissociation stimulator like 1 n=1 Tax=Ovis aries TaxID=9940 RepID=A0AC11DQA9_SHEEP